MKKLSFKTFVSLLLVFVLSFSVVYMPGMSIESLAADCSNGHDFTAQKIGANYLKSESTCGKKAVYYYSCSVCGISSAETNDAKTFEFGTAPEHDWSTFVTVGATCTKGEQQKRTCQRCGENYIRNVSGSKPLGHIYEVRSNGDGTHSTLCKRAGCGLNEKENCSSANLVCGVIPTCDVCNTKYGTTAAHELTKTTVTKTPTCTENGEAIKECARCDYTEKEVVLAEGHKFTTVTVIEKVTCSTDGKESVKCSVCGATEERTVPAPGHKYKKTTVPPTCKEQGYDLFECEVCGESHKSNYNTNLAHDYVETRTEATCDKTGLITYKCKTCGLSKDSEVIPALGHDMSGFVVTTAPTCTEGGIKTDKCSRCSRTITETLPANGHNLENEVVEATCTEIGYTLSKCKNCTYTAKDTYVDPLGHDKVLVNSIDPSCTYNGWKVYTCSRCLLEMREEVAPLGHSFDYKSDGNATCTSDGTKSGKCTRCPQTSTVTDEGSKLGHAFTLYISNNNATCTNNATQWAACDRGCGAKDVKDVPDSALGHIGEKIEGKDADCTNTGLTDGEKCKRCNEITKAQEVIPAKGHVYTSEIITAPTCSTSGTANFKCESCGDTYVGEVAATGEHKWDAGTVVVPANCDDDGEMSHKCETCDKTKTEKINRLGHEWSTEYTVDIQATCYREGEKSKHCTREGCSGKIDTLKIAMLEHDLGDYESNGDATCENDGTKSKKCKVCTYKTNPVQDPGTALGHKFTNYVSDGNTTCTADGTKTAACDNGCGMKNTEIEKSTGHDPVTNAAKPATCTEPGLTEGKTCGKCGEIIVAQEIVDATGHNEAIKAEKKPTCTKTGLTQGIYCINCEEDIIPQESIPALGHDYKKTITKATTSADGKIDGVCNRCSKKASKAISKVASIKLSTTTFYYNGETQAPEKAVVKDSAGKTLKEGTDYEIDYTAGTISAKVGTYKVKVVLKGNYKGSKTLSFKIVPAKIKTIKTTKATTAIKLTWSKSSGATGYRVYKYDTSKKKWVIVKSSTTATNYTISKLTSGKTYTFAVKPYYKKGDTVIWGTSTQWETATLPATPKATVKSNSARAATVTWNKISGATGYVVYYSTEKNGTYTKAKATTGTTVTLKNLTAGKGIYFKVRAYRKTANGNVYGAYSTPVKVVPRVF